VLVSDLSKQLSEDKKFLEKLRIAAMDQKDSLVPYGAPELWISKCWLVATLNTLNNFGYEVKIKDEKTDNSSI
jgi:hypothetical protein